MSLMVDALPSDVCPGCCLTPPQCTADNPRHIGRGPDRTLIPGGPGVRVVTAAPVPCVDGTFRQTALEFRGSAQHLTLRSCDDAFGGDSSGVLAQDPGR